MIAARLGAVVGCFDGCIFFALDADDHALLPHRRQVFRLGGRIGDHLVNLRDVRRLAEKARSPNFEWSTSRTTRTASPATKSA